MQDTATQPYRQIAYDFLTSQIVSQTYRVGDKLNERQIALELGISRTPVREAIHMLASEGWVTVVPRVGTVVNGMTSPQIEEVFQVRLSLETLSVGLLAGRVSAELIDTLRALVEAQQRCSRRDTREFIRLDNAFHTCIAEKAGNELLRDILVRINAPLVRIGLQSKCTGSRYSWSIREHGAIIDALEAGNRREAVRAMRRHIERTGRSLQKQCARVQAAP